MPSTDTVTKAVLDGLERMDREAGPTADGVTTGLWWYGAHARPELKRPRTEPEWTRRLCVLLNDAGLETRSEVRYPDLGDGKRRACDLVVALRDGPMWIEVKGAWKDYWHRRGNLATYRSYLLHPLVRGLDASKTHTVPFDLERLASLPSAAARTVAMVVVGFDQPDCPMDADVDELRALARLNRDPWVETSRSWPDPWTPGRQVHVWIWSRPVGDTSP